MIARKHTQKAAQKTMTPNGATPQLSQGTHFPTQAGKRFLSCSFPLTPTPTSLRGVVDNHGIIKRTLFRTSGEALPPTSRSPSRCTWRSQKAPTFCSLTTTRMACARQDQRHEPVLDQLPSGSAESDLSLRGPGGTYSRPISATPRRMCHPPAAPRGRPQLRWPCDLAVARSSANARTRTGAVSTFRDRVYEWRYCPLLISCTSARVTCTHEYPFANSLY